MKISSSDFIQDGAIDIKFSCDGTGEMPNIEVSDIPGDVKSLVLIVDDPDAPNGTFTHFVLFNIPILSASMEIGSVVDQSVKGKNSRGEVGYVPPCPPSGAHRYFFKIYALSIILDLPEGSDPEEVEATMQKFILNQAQLVGTYSRESSR